MRSISLIACLGRIGIISLSLLAGCGSKIHQQAPDFELERLNPAKDKVILSEVVEEGPVLLAFWATWCPSCAKEIPILNEWNERFAQKGLRIYGINIQESREKIVQYANQHPIKYPILLDQDGAVAERFGLVGLPVTVYLAKGGEILYYGYSLPGHMDQLLE